MGSGGHTTEMISLLKEMNDAYSPRIYIIAETDQMSQQKVRFFSDLLKLSVGTKGNRGGRYANINLPMEDRDMGECPTWL